ncbi:hypothetical protein JCM11641_004239 [Rhodosporidiobolus odoratus]
MAPYLSMLPVRAGKQPPSALPRPISHPPPPRSTSQPQSRPQLPEPPTPARSVAELSRFDFGGLLNEHEDGDALLGDFEPPSWLADQSAFTIAARTPARDKGKARVVETVPLSPGMDTDNEDDELMLVSMGGENAGLSGYETGQGALPPRLAVRDRAEFSPADSTFTAPAQAEESLPSSSVLLSKEPLPAPQPPPRHTARSLSLSLGPQAREVRPLAAPPTPALNPLPVLETASMVAQPPAPEIAVPAVAAQDEAGAAESQHFTSVPARHRPSLAPLPHPVSLPHFETETTRTTPSAPDALPDAALLAPSPVTEDATAFPLVNPLPAHPPTQALPANPEAAAPSSLSAAPPLADPSSRKPRPSTSTLAPLSRPAHLLPLDHPAHRRVSLSAFGLGERKKRSQDLGDAENEEAEMKKRKVREAKEERERERKVRERKKEGTAGPAKVSQNVEGKTWALPPSAASCTEEQRMGDLDEGRDEEEQKKAALVKEAEKLLAALSAPVDVEDDGNDEEKRGAAVTTVAFVPRAILEKPAADVSQAQTSASAEALQDDTSPPDVSASNFDLDADMSLPQMGAPLDLARLGGGGLSASVRERGRGGVMSTPARGVKRKVVQEEEKEGEEAEEARREVGLAGQNGVDDQKIEGGGNRARRTTLAAGSLAPVQEQEETSTEDGVIVALRVEPEVEFEVEVEVKQEEADENVAPPPPTEHALPASTCSVPQQPKLRRRPSRVSLALPAGDDTHNLSSSVSFALAAPVSLSQSQSQAPRPGKAIRVSLVAPEAPKPAKPKRASLSASVPTLTALSKPQRRVSRVSTARELPPPDVASVEPASTSSTQAPARPSLAPIPHAQPEQPICFTATDSTCTPAPPPCLATSTTLSRPLRRASRVSLGPSTEATSVAPCAEGTEPAEQAPAALGRSHRRASRVSPLLRPPVSAAAELERERASEVEQAVEGEQRTCSLGRLQRRASRVPPLDPAQQDTQVEQEEEGEEAVPPTASGPVDEQRHYRRTSCAPPPPTPPRRSEPDFGAARSVPQEPAVAAQQSAAVLVSSTSASAHSTSTSQTHNLGASTSSTLRASTSISTSTTPLPIKPPPIPAPVSNLTLPASFAFAASSDREMERKRRKEERERRDRERQEERMKAVGGNAKDKGKEKRVGGQIGREERAKRPKLASSLSSSAKPPNLTKPIAVPRTAKGVSAPLAQPIPIQHGRDPAPRQPRSRPTSTLSASTAPHRRPRPSTVDPSTGDRAVPEAAPEPASRAAPPLQFETEQLRTASLAPAAEPEPAPEVPLAALTKAALETNTRVSGSRGDLKRRVSRFLDEIVDGEAGDEEMGHEREHEEVQQEHQHELDTKEKEQQRLSQPEEEEEQIEAPEPEALAASTSLAPHPTVFSAPGPPPPSAPTAPTGPLLKKTAPTASKPFTFGTSRSSRPRPAPTTTVSASASPLFVERLSTWKNREAKLAASTLAGSAGMRVRKALESAPGPAPARAPGSGSGSAAGMPPPAAKRARVQAPATTTTTAGPRARKAPATSTSTFTSGEEKENRAIQPTKTDRERPRHKERERVIVQKGVAEEIEKRLKEKLEWSERQKRRAEEIEKRLKEKLEWSERQKRREEEVRRVRERAREEEANNSNRTIPALSAIGIPGPALVRLFTVLNVSLAVNASQSLDAWTSNASLTSSQQ